MNARLERVVVEGFRGYGERAEFDCSGDVIILVGSNGWGKTSFFDAITWCLFGRIPRLLGTRDSVGEELIRNRFMSEIDPSVSISLTVESHVVLIARDQTGLRVVTPTVELRGEDADQWVSELVVGGRPTPATSTMSFDDPTSVFLRCIHLSQDQMAAFLREASPRDRFDTLASLLGLDMVRSFSNHIGRITKDISDLLDRSRTRERQFEQRLASLRNELERVREGDDGSATTMESLSEAYTGLVARLGEESILSDVASVPHDPGSLASSARDLSVQLSSAADAEQARSDELVSLMTLREPIREDIAQIEQIQASHEDLSAQSEEETQRVAALEREVGELTAELNDLRGRRDVAEAENGALISLLSLAKERLAPEACPVCGQSIEVSVVSARIDERLATLPPSLRATQEALANKEQHLQELRRELAAARGRASTLDERARGLIDRMSELTVRVERYRARLSAAGTSLEERAKSLSDANAAALARAEQLKGLAAECDLLAERLTVLVNRERVEALLLEQAPIASGLNQAVDASRVYAAAGDVADEVVGAARRSERHLMEEVFDSIQPTLSVLYGRLRPHPVLDSLRLDIGSFGERGEVRFVAHSPGTEANVSNIFSTAQLNAVAVCVFLSMNLGMRSDVGFALLDDPIQNMDDFNVLGLLDVLKGLVGERQFVISTHDEQIGDLVRRKLRPTVPGQHTITHYFRAFRAAGPIVETRVDTHRPEPSVLEAVAGG